MVILYWQIGRDIIARFEQSGWGKKIIERLSQDLRKAFPDMKGFSLRNLEYMQHFAEAWPDEQILQQVVAKIPWGHNVRLIDRVKDAEARLCWLIKSAYEAIRMSASLAF